MAEPVLTKTYGKLWLGKCGKWFLQVDPHVAIRLKRIFHGIWEAERKDIRLSNTDETCRDLLWFVNRYPLEIDPDSLTELEAGATRQIGRVENVTRILDGDFQLPNVNLAIPVRPYQEEAAAMVFNGRQLLFVGEIGIGKTASAIRVMADTKALPALAVVPAPLTHQWRDEIHKFLPDFRVHIVKRGTPYDLSENGVEPHVIVISYAKLAGWCDHLAGKMKFVVFDEAQELRTGGLARKNIAAAQVASLAEYRLGTTATPIYNYGGEIWNVVDTLAPGALGEQTEFLREWCNRYHDVRKAQIANPQAFSSYLRDSGLMLRRTRDDIGRQLPPINTIVHEISGTSPEALQDIKTAASELAQIVLDQAKSGFERMQAGGQFDMLMRQATGISKAAGVAGLVQMIAEQEEKIVLFGWHRAVYDLWADLLKDLHPAWYTGSESPAKKRRETQRFLEGDARVLIMSLRSGLGLEGLQHVCATAVHGELDWSFGVHEQCNGRLQRDGQTRPVFAYYPIVNDGSDPIVVDVLGFKRRQLEGLRDPEGASVVERKVDPEHIKKLAEHYLARCKRKP